MFSFALETIDLVLSVDFLIEHLWNFIPGWTTRIVNKKLADMHVDDPVH